MSRENFWPTDTENEIYVDGDRNISDILHLIECKWPGAKPEEFTISSEYIHTSCLTYDLYDSSDYTNFLVIRRKT